jgi:hypothetical protein
MLDRFCKLCVSKNLLFQFDMTNERFNAVVTRGGDPDEKTWRASGDNKAMEMQQRLLDLLNQVTREA